MNRVGLERGRMRLLDPDELFHSCLFPSGEGYGICESSLLLTNFRLQRKIFCGSLWISSNVLDSSKTARRGQIFSVSRGLCDFVFQSVPRPWSCTSAEGILRLGSPKLHAGRNACLWHSAQLLCFFSEGERREAFSSWRAGSVRRERRGSRLLDIEPHVLLAHF